MLNFALQLKLLLRHQRILKFVPRIIVVIPSSLRLLTELTQKLVSIISKFQNFSNDSLTYKTF